MLLSPTLLIAFTTRFLGTPLSTFVAVTTELHAMDALELRPVTPYPLPPVSEVLFAIHETLFEMTLHVEMEKLGLSTAPIMSQAGQVPLTTLMTQPLQSIVLFLVTLSVAFPPTAQE